MHPLPIPERVNGLIHVADEGHPDAMASEPRENFEIGRIAVLRLVHDDLFEPSCNCSSEGRSPTRITYSVRSDHPGVVRAEVPRTIEANPTLTRRIFVIRF